MLTKSSSR